MPHPFGKNGLSGQDEPRSQILDLRHQSPNLRFQMILDQKNILSENFLVNIFANFFGSKQNFVPKEFVTDIFVLG